MPRSTNLAADRYVAIAAAAEFGAAALALVLSLVLLPDRTRLPLTVASYLPLTLAGYGAWLVRLRRRYLRGDPAPRPNSIRGFWLGLPAAIGTLGFYALIVRYEHSDTQAAAAVLPAMVLVIVGSCAAMLSKFRVDVARRDAHE